MSVTGYTNATVFAPDGTKLNGFSTTSAVEDTNGNEYSMDSNGNPIDTLQRTLVKTTTGGNTLQWQVYQYNYYDVLNSQGGTSRYTVTLGEINVHTNFGQTGFLDISGSFPVVQSIALPDGTSYSFQYDSGTTGGHYGLLSSMTLPKGWPDFLLIR